MSERERRIAFQTVSADEIRDLWLHRKRRMAAFVLYDRATSALEKDLRLKGLSTLLKYNSVLLVDRMKEHEQVPNDLSSLGSTIEERLANIRRVSELVRRAHPSDGFPEKWTPLVHDKTHVCRDILIKAKTIEKSLLEKADAQ